MFVNKFYFNGLRNLKEQEVTINSPFTVITGKNGQGKTSFLEGLYVLSTTKSFRTTKLREIITQTTETQSCFLKTLINTEDGNKLLSAEILKDKKQFFINENKTHKVKDYFGKLKAIVFTPDDLQIIKGSPQLRRELIDKSISLVNLSFLESLLFYNAALKNRNILLAQGKSNSYVEFEVWDKLLINYGLDVLKQRLTFLREIKEIFSNYYRLISENSKEEKVQFSYKSDFLKKDYKIDSEPDFEDIENLMLNYSGRIEQDLRLKNTGLGIHRDNLIIKMDTGFGFRDSREIASQGQTRSISLALKLASVDFVKIKTDIMPLLLLDDVESELDGSRKQSLISLLENFKSQVILTTTDDSEIKKIKIKKGVDIRTIEDGYIFA